MLRLSRLESWRNPARKTDFQPGSTIAYHRLANARMVDEGKYDSDSPDYPVAEDFDEAQH